MANFVAQLLPTTDFNFHTLHASVQLERLGVGRHGAVVVDVADDGAVPIVRTTTAYAVPAQRFGAVHSALAKAIADACGDSGGAMRFNNGLLEVYDDGYATMGFHTDQSLDLDRDAYICLFSCYSTPTASRRVLCVREKATGATRDIELVHGSVVCFSVAANARHVHKIVRQGNARGGQWLGLTLRLSKTFVRYGVDGVDGDGGAPRFRDADQGPLVLANAEQRRRFISLKKAENESDTQYNYPPLNYTLSASDLVAPLEQRK